MTDAYNGWNSRRSNAPCGHFRAELVRATEDNELILSGSPIEMFCHPDYQTGNHRTGQTLKYGIEGIYSHTDTAWLDPDTVVSAVSPDGYTISLSSGVDEGDLVEVYYYATCEGMKDHQTAAQVGDVLPPETLDAVVQKLNDCPSLDFEAGGCLFDQELCLSNVKPVALGGGTVVAKYAAAQVGTWQTSNVPFYVTSVQMAWAGDAVQATRGGYSPITTTMTIDGGTARTWSLASAQHIMMPVGGGDTNYDQLFFANLGLVEVNSDFIVSVNPYSFDVSAGSFTTTVSGWYIP